MKKLLFTLLITLALPLFVGLPAVAGAQTLSDLEIKIAALFAEIQTLQTELQTLKQAEPTQTPSASVSLSSFITTLGKGSEGSEVTALQTFLAKDPTLYPEGLITGYYGSLTEAAVKRFQQKHNIVSAGTPLTTGYGQVGPATRAKLNALLTTTSSTPPTPTPTPTTPASPAGGPASTDASQGGPNRSPNLSITGERFVTLPNKATLTAIATDDGKPGGALTYLWSKTGGPGSVTFSSLTTRTTTLTFSTAGTYQITATVSDGDLFASYTIGIIAAPASPSQGGPASTPATTTPPATTTTPTLPAPTLSFTATKTTLTKGTATTLTWSSTNTTSCTASNGWTGSKTASGSTTLTPVITTTYTLSCKGGAGDVVAKSVTVVVTAVEPVPSPIPQPIAGADLNGYVAEYECRKGNPNCDVDIETLTKKSCDTIVYPSDSDWSKIEDHPEYTTYCIAAGDHTNKNVLYLLFSGTSNNRKVLRYYDSPDDGAHPVRQSPNKRARLFAVQLKNSASYWLVHRLTFDAGGANVNASVRFSWGDGNKGSSFNIFDRLLFQNDEAHFFQMGNNGHPDNTIQNSVLRNPVISRQFEAQCINASGGPRLHIVNNEIYNCQKGIAIGDGVWTHEGLIIENNDVYATTAAYTDCKGNYNGTGPCAITEDLISLKAGGIAENPSRIFNNRLWGSRNGDDNLGLTLNGSGSSIGLSNTGVSDGLQVQQGYYGGDYVRIDKNIIFDSGEGVSPVFPVADHISIIGNIFWKIKGKNWDWSFDTVTLDFGATNLAETYFNAFIDSGVLHRFGWGNTHDTQCNQFINLEGVVDGDLRSGVVITKNAFYNTPAFTTASPAEDITRSSASDSKNTEYCFYRKLLTNPEQVCIPYAKTTTASPHYSQCSAGAGQRAGIGINDKIWTWADTLFNF